MTLAERIKAKKLADAATQSEFTSQPAVVKSETAELSPLQKILAKRKADREAKAPAPIHPPGIPEPEKIVETKISPIQERIARAKAIAAGKVAATGLSSIPESTVQEGEWIPKTVLDNGIGLNEKQEMAVTYGRSGKSFVVTGAAGTGKTTAQAGVVKALMDQDSFGVHDFKYIGEQPSIAIVAFTKVAVRNIQKALAKNASIAHFAAHCMTIHSLLEYCPVPTMRLDAETGLEYESMTFEPQRNSYNPLKITHLVLEEASMCGIDLWLKLWAALPSDVQIIQLGDINQLQPVFGNPILAYALNRLPVIELTHVYRQALDNPIIANAHRVLVGLPFESSEDGKVALISGTAKYKVGQSQTALGISAGLKQLYESGEYDPEQDMVLSPWNKRELGTKAMNNHIGTFLAMAKGQTIYHIKGGLNEVYLGVGDRVMYDKQFGVITRIETNSKYVGRITNPPGMYTRTGIPIVGGSPVASTEQVENTLSFEANYDNFDLRNYSTGEGGDLDDNESISQRAASHNVFVVMDDTGVEVKLSSGGDFAYEKFQLGYCLTVYKAQGSEWRKVFLIAHYDHAPMLSRECIYTALTRAREVFACFGKPEVIARACARAEIKGDTLEDKIAYFSAKVTDLENIPITKSEDDIEKYGAYVSEALGHDED